MEGGQKQFIDLSAGLDIHSSDMIVPISRCTFSHNWQKLQGSYLPNSLRFEKNGWAAGWNVYNFNYNVFEKKVDDIFISSVRFNEFAILLTIREEEDVKSINTKEITVVPETVNKNNDLQVIDNSISGTINDKQFTITKDSNEWVIDNNLVGFELYQNEDYAYSLLVYDKEKSFDFTFSFYLPSELTGDYSPDVQYTGFENGIHNWDKYKYNPDSNIIEYLGRNIIPSRSGNLLQFSYTETVLDEYFTINADYEKRYYSFQNCNAGQTEFSSNVITSNTDLYGGYDFNTYEAKIIGSTKLSPGSRVIVDVIVPVWLTVYSNGTVLHNGIDATGLYSVNGGNITARSGQCWCSSASFNIPTSSGSGSGSESAPITFSGFNFPGNVRTYKNSPVYTREGVASVPLEGHIVYEITYSRLATLVELTTPGNSIMQCNICGGTPVGDVIYVDRGGVRGYDWFYLVNNGIMPDNSDGTGSVTLTLSSKNGGKLYFGTTPSEFSGSSEAPYFAPNYNLRATVDFFTMEVRWNPEVYEFPISCALTFSNQNTKVLSHNFYTNHREYLNITTDSIIDIDAYTSEVTFSYGEKKIKLRYLALSKTFVPYVNEIIEPDYKLTIPSISGNTAQCNLDLYYLNMRMEVPDTENCELISIKDNIATVQKNNAVIHYNYITQQIIDKYDNNIDILNDKHIIYVNYKDSLAYNFALKFATEGTINNNLFTFIYKGHSYTINLDEFYSEENFVEVLSTDVRTPDKTKIIGKLDIGKETIYQLIKQQWESTSEVENYWWIDSRHILELNKYYFILKKKSNDVDDWNGDKWEEIYRVIRPNILSSSIEQYFVTGLFSQDSIDSHALFLTFEFDVNRIKCVVYDPINKMEKVTEFFIIIKRHELGTQLNDLSFIDNECYFNTYSPILTETLLASARWSATIRDNKLILGCHYNNNFNQWACVFDLDTKIFVNCIQGYGFVSVKGDLTGGQIPQKWFDVNKGFSGTVEPLSSIIKQNINIEDIDAVYEVENLNNVNKFEEKVIGSAEQQWYIARFNYGIVSHLLYNNGRFNAQVLPLTNNYDSIYKSPSFMSALIGDFLPKPYGLNTMFEFDGAGSVVWQLFCGLLGEPALWFFQPRQSVFGYLQQTFGQYAYVHYNSSITLPEKEKENSLDDTNDYMNQRENSNKKVLTPLLNEAHAFDKQVFSQESKVSIKFSGFLTMLSVFLVAMELFDKKNAVNEEQNQSAVSDIGRKFQAQVLENVENLVSSSIYTQSATDSGLVSRIAGIKSLDMFYSTCDKQNVYAGPGFVEHQFVANCIAQSSTDVNAEGKVIQSLMCLKVLTELQHKLVAVVTQAAIDYLEQLGNGVGSANTLGVAIGPVLATALLTMAKALKAVQAAQEVAWQAFDELATTMTNKGITSTITGFITKHSLSVEGKHKYGEKNETFMWPCWGVNNNELEYTDTQVVASIKNKPWQLALSTRKLYRGLMLKIAEQSRVKYSSLDPFMYSNSISDDGDLATVVHNHEGKVPFYVASCLGKNTKRWLPNNMAKVEGVSSFMPEVPFKNENINVSDPVFTPSAIQDYIIDERWDLSVCATYGHEQWITCKDTKLINCPPSNIIATKDFCGVASPYTAIEVKKGLSKKYMRPVAITPNVLMFNCTGYNCVMDNILYHAFDGISYRIVDLIGAPGMGKNFQSFIYQFQLNDRLKRSNKCPPNEFLGNFNTEPVHSVKTKDPVYTLLTVASKEKGLEAGVLGEDKDVHRYAIPIFVDNLTTLPATIRTLTATPLVVVDGVTSLCTDQLNNLTAYKAPVSIDFTINKNVFRMTEDYICSVTVTKGIEQVTDIVPTLGLKFIGTTPTAAYLYSKATRSYYVFTGSTSLNKVELLERFRDVKNGYYDFVNQEVIMPCLMTYKRLNNEIEDKDSETDNIIVPILSGNQVSGELPPPLTTIFNDESWYQVKSLPSGLAYQGPNRVIINRDIFVEYMLDSLKSNLGKWKKVNREKYSFKRDYKQEFSDVLTDVKGVDGWTHNPFVLVTSPLGYSENTDCLFEWEITFCWPIEMDLIYNVDNFATVNICAETVLPGGKKLARPTHVYLTKELFTRREAYGYYTFRYQSKNGAGNRERLMIWSDQYIAISSLVCESKVITQRRSEVLTQQIDIQNMKEL